MWKVTTQFKVDGDSGNGVYFVWAGSEGEAKEIVAHYAHKFMFVEIERYEK